MTSTAAAAPAGAGARRAAPPAWLRRYAPFLFVLGLGIVVLALIGPQQFVNALTIGAIYALVALGYTMVYGIIELINFAHGDIFMVGAFASIIFLGGIMGQTGQV